VSKKWVFIMGKRLDKNAAPAPAKTSRTSAQDRNHTTSSLPQQTRSNAYPDKRIWMKGPATFNPLNWHCFGFALDYHFFQHPLSPYDEKSAQDVAKLLPRMKEQASTATVVLGFRMHCSILYQGRHVGRDKQANPISSLPRRGFLHARTRTHWVTIACVLEHR